MSHYCIGNPCWICYPTYAPTQDSQGIKTWQKLIDNHKIPEQGISGNVYNLLIAVFEQGLDEDAHFYYMSNPELKLEDIVKEREHVNNDSLEAALLDLLIEDLKVKNTD